jgi:hypothetical protein
MTEPPAEVIRLSTPADLSFLPVLDVAISVLARRGGMAEDELIDARAATATAFTAAVGGEAGTVQVEVDVLPRHLDVRLLNEPVDRSFRLPPA